jgi:hypothetical protein
MLAPGPPPLYGMTGPDTVNGRPGAMPSLVVLPHRFYSDRPPVFIEGVSIGAMGL